MSLKHLLVATAMISVSQSYPGTVSHTYVTSLNLNSILLIVLCPCPGPTREVWARDCSSCLLAADPCYQDGSFVAGASPCCGSSGAWRSVQFSVPQTQGALQSYRRGRGIRWSWNSLTADPVHRERADRTRYQLRSCVAVSIVMSTCFYYTRLHRVIGVSSSFVPRSSDILLATRQQMSVLNSKRMFAVSHSHYKTTFKQSLQGRSAVYHEDKCKNPQTLSARRPESVSYRHKVLFSWLEFKTSCLICMLAAMMFSL